MPSRISSFLKSEYLKAFRTAAFSAIQAVLISAILFPGLLGYSTLGLTSTGLRLPLEEFVEENSTAIWGKSVSPWRANAVFVLKLICFFVAIFSVTFLIELFVPNWLKFTLSGPQKFYGSERWSILRAQFMTLGVGLVLAFLYRTTGVLFILCKAAMNGGLLLATFIDVMLASKQAWWTPGVFLMVPHLTVAAISYTMTGMSGLFFRRAISKYSWRSWEFWRVARACSVLLLFSLLMILVSTEVELAFGRFMNSLAATP